MIWAALRVMLGGVIFARGIVFIQDTEVLLQMMMGSGFLWTSLWLAYYLA